MSPLDRLRWLAEIATCNTFKGGSVIRSAVVLANYCNNVTGIAYPSIPTIAKEAGITEESVRNALSSLETMKFLAINRSAGGAPCNTNKYRLTLEGTKPAPGVKRTSGVNSAPGVKHSLPPPQLEFSAPPYSSSPKQGIKQTKNKLTASSNAVLSDEQMKESYSTKRGRELKGQQLEWFNQFWETFDYKKGKAEAADAWIDSKVTENLFSKIISAAKHEVRTRTKQGEKGPAVKWAQGWLSGRRWEDLPVTSPGTVNSTNSRQAKSIEEIIAAQSL